MFYIVLNPFGRLSNGVPFVFSMHVHLPDEDLRLLAGLYLLLSRPNFSRRK
nr:MAG TPA: hypothetical protein [Caudoviricetes sp.]